MANPLASLLPSPGTCLAAAAPCRRACSKTLSYVQTLSWAGPASPPCLFAAAHLKHVSLLLQPLQEEIFKDVELSSDVMAAMSAAIAALSYQITSPPHCCLPGTCPAAALTWHLPRCCCPLQEGMFKDIELSSDVMAAMSAAIAALSYQITSPPRCCLPGTCLAAAALCRRACSKTLSCHQT